MLPLSSVNNKARHKVNILHRCSIWLYRDNAAKFVFAEDCERSLQALRNGTGRVALFLVCGHEARNR